MAYAIKPMDHSYDASDEDDQNDDKSLIVPCTTCQYYSTRDENKWFGLKNCHSKHYNGPLWTKTEIVHGTARMIQMWWNKHQHKLR